MFINKNQPPQLTCSLLKAVDRGFDPHSDQTKDYKIGNYCFSHNHAIIHFSDVTLLFERWIIFKNLQSFVLEYMNFNHLLI